jgi:hypothetical protein
LRYKSQLFAQAGEQRRWQRDDQTLSGKKDNLCRCVLGDSEPPESTVRRFTTTTTIEARGRVAQIKALCLF